MFDSATTAPRKYRRKHLITPLDRYVGAEFIRIFIVSALGLPGLVFVIDLVDNLRKYTERKLPPRDVALSYFFWLPDTMFMILPAATLFATVFAIGAFTRYSEITAAKASGISFYRFLAPILALAFGSMALGLAVGQIAPPFNARRLELLRGKLESHDNERYNFAFANDRGRVYRVWTLDVKQRTLAAVEVEERRSKERPGLLVSAKTGDWKAKRGWALQDGVMHVIPNETADVAFAFDSLHDRAMHETAQELRASEKTPEEMNFQQLSRFIRALERSGADVNAFKVDRMLKLAVPVTCVIIALFGAPLATSSNRGGAAYGVAISLATTIVFLMLIQLTKAIGGKGVIAAEPAAWLPNVAVGLIAVILLARVRT